MKKLLIASAMLFSLSAPYAFAYNYGPNSNSSPIEIVLVGETAGAYNKKFCSYQKFKFGQLIAQYTKTVHSRMACPIR